MVIPNQLESILNILHFPMTALLRVWHEVRHHGILAHEIVLLAGAKRSERSNLHLIANNLRFLVLPWVQVSCLASYLLALNRHRLSQDWQNLYHHPVYLLETFVDTRAISWDLLQGGQLVLRGPDNRSGQAQQIAPTTTFQKGCLCLSLD